MANEGVDYALKIEKKIQRDNTVVIADVIYFARKAP